MGSRHANSVFTYSYKVRIGAWDFQKSDFRKNPESVEDVLWKSKNRRHCEILSQTQRAEIVTCNSFTVCLKKNINKSKLKFILDNSNVGFGWRYQSVLDTEGPERRL